jgi:4-hydroxy-tetrahydrodipicolinate reductase
MKIALIGTGNMGKIVHSLADEKGYEAVVTINEDNASVSAQELSQQLCNADVAIDFSIASAVKGNVKACMLAGLPIVEGTTGWTGSRDEIRKIVMDHDGAMVFGANFSIGVNLFYRLIKFAAELFAKFPEYEVFIEEQHHSRKKDAPSGTALKLKDILSHHVDKDFCVSSTRAGNIPGTHRVGFDGQADQILLEHVARSREGFAAGALLAAEWIIGKRGFYEFDEVMSEILS